MCPPKGRRKTFGLSSRLAISGWLTAALFAAHCPVFEHEGAEVSCGNAGNFGGVPAGTHYQCGTAIDRFCAARFAIVIAGDVVDLVAMTVGTLHDPGTL